MEHDFITMKDILSYLNPDFIKNLRVLIVGIITCIVLFLVHEKEIKKNLFEVRDYIKLYIVFIILVIVLIALPIN